MGGNLPALLEALKARQMRQADLQRAIGKADREKAPRVNKTAVERAVRERLTRWRSMLTGNDGRQLLRETLVGPIRFIPDQDAALYRFEGEVALGRLFSGIASLTPFLASPSGTGFNYMPVFRGKWIDSRPARAAA
jgi:hypothetical protein